MLQRPAWWLLPAPWYCSTKDFMEVVPKPSQAEEKHSTGADASEATAKHKKMKQKRSSIFSAMHDSHSERLDMITPDACFSLIHVADAALNIDLHLEKSASRSRVAGGVAKRRDVWVDAFRHFLERAKE